MRCRSRARFNSMAKTATPWGRATLVEHLTVQQRAGERLVRFAYSTGGAVRRGPVTLRARDVERLHAALAKTPELADALGLGGA